MTLITSRRNQSVKLARSLRARKTRKQEGLFLAEGIRLAVQAERSGARVVAVITCPLLLQSAVALASASALAERGAELVSVTADVFRSLSPRDNPQGIMVIAQSALAPLSTAPAPSGLCQVALQNPQDPGNVGSILRTCEAVGAGGVILIGDAVDPYDPTCVRASLGAIFTQPILTASSAELGVYAQRFGVMLVGVTGSAPNGFRDVRCRRPLMFVMGSERGGLDPSLPFATHVSIPMRGEVDSLNVSVAAAVVLYEALVQLDATPDR